MRRMGKVFLGVCSLLLVVTLLLLHPSFGWDEGAEPIHISVMKGDLPAVKEMLDWDQDVNAGMRGTGVTPLHIAAQISDVEMARILLRRGAKINARDVVDYTPLHYAAELGRPEMVGLLLNHGADPNARTISGYTPLHCAIKGAADWDKPNQRHPQTALVLLRNGARLDNKIISGLTEFDLSNWNRFGTRRWVWNVIEREYVRRGGKERTLRF